MRTKSDDVVYCSRNIVTKINDYVYRYLSFNRLVELIIKKRFFIPQVKTWDDVYELFLAKTTIEKSYARVSYIDSMDSFYGQCWSFKAESDALWRIYSPDKTGVRIKCKLKNVANALRIEENHVDYSTVRKEIGVIRYMKVKDVEKWTQALNTDEININTIRDSLFIKRNEFSHENEVRIIIHKAFGEYENQKQLLSFIIDPNSLIEEVTFDPRIYDGQFELNSKVLKSVGYENRITKSGLYTFNFPKISCF